jgi:F0F1-type ATP synthase epsilon subunit
MFNLILFYNENKLFEGMVKSVDVITKGGPTTVLPQHVEDNEQNLIRRSR